MVPISGGLDSRAILAALLEHTEAHRIHTFTFGTPDTLDYNIGCEIANKLGTRHTAFDLTQHIYTQDELEDIARRIDHQAILFHHWPVWQTDKLFSGALIWSGFLGETLTGSHRPKTPAQDLAAATTNFISRNRYVKSYPLAPERADFTPLIAPPIINQIRLTLEEQLDLRNRQTKFIAPIVLMKKNNWRTPFRHQPWIDFILSVPDEHRQGQSLYKKILSHAFPGPFAHRTKSTGGLPLKATKYQRLVLHGFRRFQGLFGARSQGINYLDFNWAFREKADLRNLITQHLADLNARKLFEKESVDCVLKRHLNRQANHADALIVLASLEIHIKSGMPLCRVLVA